MSFADSPCLWLYSVMRWEHFFVHGTNKLYKQDIQQYDVANVLFRKCFLYMHA